MKRDAANSVTARNKLDMNALAMACQHAQEVDTKILNVTEKLEKKEKETKRYTHHSSQFPKCERKSFDVVKEEYSDAGALHITT